MYNKKGISVIICCYNSAERLPETLAHIAKQKQVLFDWEVIIVDNASTDQTSEIARKEWEKYETNAGFVIVDQPVPGLSSARDKGATVAQYEYLLFCDDDNWLNEDFLAISYQVMEEYPEIGVLGGQSQVASDIELPDWFFEKSMVFAVGKQAAASGPLLNIDQSLYGACMVVRKSLLQWLDAKGFKYLNTDRFGNKLSGGGDVELGKALRLANYQLYYDERLRFKHYMPASRVNWPYFLKLGEGSASSRIPIFVYDCLLKYPDLGVSKFICLYIFKVGQLSLKILKRPGTVFKHCFNIRREGDLEYFEVMRLIVALSTFVSRAGFSIYCYRQINFFNENIKSELSPKDYEIK